MNPQPIPESFQTTQWSMVRRAAGLDDAAASVALGALCERCWYPIYAFFRRSGKSPHDAEDFTQGFFAGFLQKALFADADPARGRLRTFLLSCARNFLLDEHDRANARRRGAGLVTSFDAGDAEHRYAADAANDLSPDRLFQRRWAISVLDQSLRLLGDEYAAQGKADLFTALRPFLGFGPNSERRYEELSPALGTPVGTLKNHVFRLRARWRELLFEQVGATLDNPTPDEIKAELAELIGCV